jgi:hypothetical protein
MTASPLPTTDRTGAVLLSGASGLIGAALATSLEADGQPVLRLSRSPQAGRPGTLHWQPGQELEPALLDGLRAVVHLAGAPIAARWTAKRMAAIRDSRVDGTAALARSVAGCSRPPEVFVCASAVGYYGDTADRVVEESAPQGDGFLADVCRAWEDAARPAAEAGIRVVNLRFGLVLDPAGGALGKMLPAFRCGFGGPLGSGRQYMSWIALPDVVGAARFALDHPTLQGPVNIVAPEAVTNRTFTKTLAKTLHRPAFLPLPAVALRLLFGRMADEALLASTRVRPAALLDAGFPFQYPDLAGALQALLTTQSSP